MQATTVIHSLSTPAAIESYRERLAEWVDAGLTAAGETNSSFGRVLGVGPSEGSKIRSGSRRILADQLFAISAFIQRPAPVPDGWPVSIQPISVPIIGEAGRSMWYDEEPAPDANVTLAHIPAGRFLDLPHFATRVVGDAMNSVLPDGSFAIYVPYRDARSQLTEGDIVLLKHRVADRPMHKRLIRRVIFKNGCFELRSESSTKKADTDHLRMSKNKKCLEGSTDTIEVVGLVVWQCGAISL